MPAAVRLVRLLCRLREQAKAGGRHEVTHERRCARLVLQGVLTMTEAEDALTLLHAGIKREPDVDALRLETAGVLLREAIERERVARYVCEREMRAACDAMLRERRPSGEMLDELRAMNAEMGGPFVWPELREILARQIQWFLRQSRSRRPKVGAHV